MAFQGDSIFWVEVEKVVPNPYQPRREFDEHKLKELAESIRMYGILQPLTVTRKEVQREDGTFFSEYELIAGERRLRASKIAQINQVPVIIRDGEQSEQEKLELAIIENLQREDLNAVDRALAFQQLAETFGLSHSKVAEKVGRSREYVSNSIRLLQLPDYMQSSLKLGDISEGHARTLLMLNDRPEEQDTVFREVLLKKLSVREVENIARKIATDKVRKKNWHGLDPEIVELEKEFTETLGTRVQIVKTDYGGKVTFDYFDATDLAHILALLKKEEDKRGGPDNSAVHDAVKKLAQATPLAAVSEEEEEAAVVTTADASQTSVSTAPEVAVASDREEEPQPDTTPTPVTEVPKSEPKPVAATTVPEPVVQSHTEQTESVMQTAEQVSEPALVEDTAQSESPSQTDTQEPVNTPDSIQADTPLQQPEEPSEPKKDDDESTLYSIRNFSV